MNDHALDAMIYAWLVMKEKEDAKMIEYINLGEVVNVNTYLTSASDNIGSHVIIDFLADDSVNFDRVQNDISKLLKRPKNYILCDIEDVIEARREFANLKKRVEELEDQLADQKKKYDKKLCEAFMETNAALHNGVYRLIAIDKEIEDLKKQAEQIEELEKENQTLKDRNGELANGLSFMGDSYSKLEKDFKEAKKDLKAANKQLDKMDADIDELKNKNRDLEKELAESKTFAEVEYKWQSDGSFTATYTKHDGTKEAVGMDLAGAIDATSISCGTIPKCKSCKNHRYYGKIGGHVCHLPDSKCIIPNTFDIFPLTDEEAEGPACEKFETKE